MKKKELTIKSIVTFVKEKKLFFGLLFFSLSIFLLWLLAFFPGAMSNDSIYQWSQVLGVKPLDDWHPYIHTLILLLLSKVWNNPGVVSLFQIVFSAFLISYATYFVIKKGASKKIALASYFLFVFSIPVGYYNITLWKDVLFAQLIFSLVIIFASHFLSVKNNKKEILVSYLPLISLSFLIALISVVRHNGIIYLVAVPVLYFLLKLVPLNRIVKIFGISLLFVIFFKMIVFSALNIQSTKVEFMVKERLMAKITGSIFNDPNSKITKDQKEVLLTLAPEKIWRNYNCEHDVSFINSKEFNKNNILNDKGFNQKWHKVFFELVKANPWAAINDRVCLGKGVVVGNSEYFKGVKSNNLGIAETPIAFNETFAKILNWSFTKPATHLIWSYFLVLPLFIGSLFFAIYKKNLLIIGYTSLVLLNIPFVIAISTASDFRYFYMIYFAAFMLIPLFTISLKGSSKKKD